MMKSIHCCHDKRIQLLIALPFLLTSLSVYAAVLTNKPDSGTVLEGAKPPFAEQEINQSPMVIVEENPSSISIDGQQKIQVRGFRFSGELPLPKSELNKLVQSEAGQELTMNQINQLADKVTHYLREQGYLVAFAYIPVQHIQDGLVEMAIVPGKYGQIKITGITRLRSNQLRAMLFAVRPGAVIRRDLLERALLLMNDLNGISVKANLKPGENPGTADLVIAINDMKTIDGTFYLDNWGNRYSGQMRSGVQINVNNPGGIGDVLNISGLLTDSSRMNDYSLGYSLPVGYDGARLAISHSRMHCVLGEEFASLGADGSAVVDDVNLTYPLIRSWDFNLIGTVGYEHKHLYDDIMINSSYSRKKSSLWNVGVTSYFNDHWLGGGSNSFSLVNYWGSLILEDAATVSSDATSTHSAGDFTKAVFNFQRQQYVTDNINFLFLFSGQLASKNLDSSEKFYLGGADGVRAYAQGEAGGDEGYRLTGEFRWRLPGASTEKNSLYLTSFYDYGSAKINQTAYPGSGINRRSLMGAGVGLLWTGEHDFAIRMDYAWKIGKGAASDDILKNGRLWLQGVTYF